MRYRALVLMLVMLLQPFAATAAIIALSPMTDVPSSLIASTDDHCAAQSQPGSSNHQPGHEHSDTADCLEECQVCTSCAGYVAVDNGLQTSAVSNISFLSENFARLPGQLFELLYRPPINS